MNALAHVGRIGDSVYSAHQTRSFIYIQFVGDKEETKIPKKTMGTHITAVDTKFVTT